MNEPTESTAQAGDQPTTGTGIPGLDSDMPQTFQWLSIANPGHLDAPTLVTHNNLGVLAVFILRMEERVIEQAEQIRNLEGGIRTVLEILRRNEEISRPSSISSSSSSSVESYLSSTSQPTPVGDGAEALTEGDQSANAFSEIIENLSVLDDFFDYFIMGSDHTTLVERSERIQASSAAFVEAATEQLGSYMGETEAEAIIAQLSSLDGEQIIDVYIGLSHRNRSSKSQGEMTITATEISRTDSQST